MTWFQSARRQTGVFTGHTGEAEPIVKGSFEREYRPGSFEALRLMDPFNRIGPAWDLVPESALWAPTEVESQRFEAVLGMTIPPGLRYIDLVDEIWHRGFEVFLVGGTVRDIVTGVPANDVDLVTSMPLRLALAVLRPMFQNDKLKVHPETGYCRLGGRPASGDPFVDLKMVCLDNPGTQNAQFGADLAIDVAHRDFACNALYYDALNKSIVDPTELGLKDAEQRRLTLIADRHRKSKIDAAKIAIRFFKFIANGYTANAETLDRLRMLFIPDLASLPRSQLIGYTRTQILSKYERSQWHDKLDAFRRALFDLDHENIWNLYYSPVASDILET